MRADAARVFARRWIDPFAATLQEFHEDLQLARRDPDGMAAFAAWKIAPFGSAIEALESWPYRENVELPTIDLDADKEADDPALDYLMFDEGRPYQNPFRDVGRNDPCPCGSGKKYKKCCLAA
jgi:hypothetical protein